MINNYILESLKLSNPHNLIEFENDLREITQKIILSALSKTSFFRHVAFYGGTALRIFHGLTRFSEDLDFQVIEDGFNVNIDECMSVCIQNLLSYGLKAFVHSKEDYDKGEIKRRYIKFPCFDIAQEFFGNISMNKERLLSVKIEVSTIYIPGFQTEMKLLPSPVFSNILCFDYASLFAGKIHALISRNWRERVKGRDYFDYMFYLSHDIAINLEYLKNKLSISLKTDTSSFTLSDIKELLKERFKNVDFTLIKNDIIPFVRNKNDIDNLDKEMFIASLDLLRCI